MSNDPNMQEHAWLSEQHICISVKYCQYCTLHLYIIDLKWVGGVEWRQWQLTMVRIRVLGMVNQGTISDPGSATGSEG